MKALVGAFNQEKALVGAFSVIVQPVVEPMDRFAALVWIQTAHSPLVTRTAISVFITHRTRAEAFSSGECGTRKYFAAEE